MPTIRQRVTDLLLGDEKRRLGEATSLLVRAYQEGPWELSPEQLVAKLQEVDSALLQDMVNSLLWDRLGSMTGYAADDDKARGRAIDESRRLWRYDVITQWIIWLWTNYGYGEHISIIPEDERGREVFEEFWNADRNQPVLAADELQAESETLGVDGEVVWVYYTAKVDGSSTIRTINTKEIVARITDPGDEDTALFYKRVWTPAGEGQDTLTWYYPDWLASLAGRLDDLPEGLLPRDAVRADEQNQLTDVVMQHIPYNRKGGWRGWPLMTAGAPWSRAHKQFRENRASVAAAIAMYVNKVKVKGGSRAVAAVRAKLESSLASGGFSDTNPSATAGSTFTENEAAELTRLTQSTGAGDAKVDGESLLLMAGLGGGVFPHWLGAGDAYRLATATAMEGPLLRQFSRYQGFWSAQFRKMVRIVLQMKKKYGDVEFDTYEADVSTDRLVEVDLNVVSESLARMYSDVLMPTVELDIMPASVARRITASVWRIALQALGVSDADEITSDESFEIGSEEEEARAIALGEHSAVAALADLQGSGAVTPEQAGSLYVKLFGGGDD